MSARCEPPEELRGRFGVHWIVRRVEGRGDLTPILMEWEIHESVGEWRYSEICAEAGWRHLAPVATPAEVAALRAEVKRLRRALRSIANQKLQTEMQEDEYPIADFHGAYGAIVEVARAALAKEPGNGG